MTASPPSIPLEASVVEISIAVSDAFKATGKNAAPGETSSSRGAKSLTMPISIIWQHVSSGLNTRAAATNSCSALMLVDRSEILPTESASSSQLLVDKLSYLAAATPLNCFLTSERTNSSRKWANFSLCSASARSFSTARPSATAVAGPCGAAQRLASRSEVPLNSGRGIVCSALLKLNLRKKDEFGEGFDPSSLMTPSVGG
mmetsp:Transcript_13009/g.20454  ORF Transcript_13009/g.20454 Transcript_13009/m.20454 type:complete len:202 (+) Transcript_13009:1407-2012(+)